ncbi:MAG: ATP-binding cassette domain-containing protein [Candidatus Hadarchaeales archaeon]
MEAREIIKVENLTKVFNRSLVAVDHVSFSVYEGEIFGFLGPNGAGKTTTINMLTTVLRPTEGTALVLGYEVTTQPEEVRRNVGVVPQEYTADEDLTGWENLMLCADLYGVPRKLAAERAEELLRLVELKGSEHRKVETYSGGMRRRLEFACGLINRPKILFLDEPTLGLDVQTRVAIWDYIRRLRKDHGTTIFLTTHYLEEADALCDRIAIIDRGKIVAMGKPSELKEGLGGDIVTLVLEGDADASALIREIEPVSEVWREDGTYWVKTKEGRVALPKIIEALGKRGFVVRKASLLEPSLNEVYMSYTGKSMRETEGGEEARRLRRVLRMARR